MTDYTELVKFLRGLSPWAFPDASKKRMNDAAAAIEVLQAAEPTEKQVVDYCHKRCLVVLEADLFYELKASYGKLPKRGEWIRVQEVDIPGEMHPAAFKCMCSVCRNEYLFPRIPRYCPDCGSMNTAKMEVQDG